MIFLFLISSPIPTHYPLFFNRALIRLAFRWLSQARKTVVMLSLPLFTTAIFDQYSSSRNSIYDEILVENLAATKRHLYLSGTSFFKFFIIVLYID